MKLKQLEDEQEQIIQLAHRPRQLATSSHTRTTASSNHVYRKKEQHDNIVYGAELVVHGTGVQSTIADLPPLDLRRVDRDFPLLFLANVCESVRAYR